MTETAQLGELPTWDLDDLYPGKDSPELKSDLADATADAEIFAAKYTGKVADLDGAALAKAIAEYERQQERLGLAMSYAHLVYARYNWSGIGTVLPDNQGTSKRRRDRRSVL